ncbi:MAG: hypothetical protein JSS81_20345 [Acidobacteria bacterium]|nr:hypothetical protein [Acidobacteriota bacterium]
MFFRDLNWKLILTASAAVSVGVNLLLILTMLFLFRSGALADETALAAAGPFRLVALFSPLWASFASWLVVSYFAGRKKVVHTVFSTLLTFLLTLLILATATLYAAGLIAG